MAFIHIFATQKGLLLLAKCLSRNLACTNAQTQAFVAHCEAKNKTHTHRERERISRELGFSSGGIKMGSIISSSNTEGTAEEPKNAFV